MVNVTTSPNVTSGLDGSMRNGGPASAAPPEDEDDVLPAAPTELLVIKALDALDVPEAGVLLPDALELEPPEEVPALDALDDEEPPPLEPAAEEELPPVLEDDELELEPPVHALNTTSTAAAFKTSWPFFMGTPGVCIQRETDSIAEDCSGFVFGQATRQGVQLDTGMTLSSGVLRPVAYTSSCAAL